MYLFVYRVLIRKLPKVCWDILCLVVSIEIVGLERQLGDVMWSNQGDVRWWQQVGKKMQGDKEVVDVALFRG